MSYYSKVENYIKTHALPKKLGRVMYTPNMSGSKDIVKLIRNHGLTPIPIRIYREMQAKEDNRQYIEK